MRISSFKIGRLLSESCEGWIRKLKFVRARPNDWCRSVGRVVNNNEQSIWEKSLSELQGGIFHRGGWLCILREDENTSAHVVFGVSTSAKAHVSEWAYSFETDMRTLREGDYYDVRSRGGSTGVLSELLVGRRLVAARIWSRVRFFEAFLRAVGKSDEKGSARKPE